MCNRQVPRRAQSPIHPIYRPISWPAPLDWLRFVCSAAKKTATREVHKLHNRLQSTNRQNTYPQTLKTKKASRRHDSGPLLSPDFFLLTSPLPPIYPLFTIVLALSTPGDTNDFSLLS